MSKSLIFQWMVMTALSLTLSPGLAFSGEAPPKPLKSVPKAYADKQMPEGWWTDAKIIAEGKRIFETTVLEYEFKRKKWIAKEGCASCHGIDVKSKRPKKRGSLDFRIFERVNRFSEAYWFWRVAEGIAKTRMPPWKEKLSEQGIWKVIAYQHTWSHGNTPAIHDHTEIERSTQK